MLDTFLLLAEAPQQNPLMQLFPLILIFIMMYFLLFRPQRKRQQQMQDMVSALKTGDKVITAGGIHGLVTNVKEKSCTLKIADNVKVEFEKTSIAHVIKKDGEGASPAPAEKPPLEGASSPS